MLRSTVHIYFQETGHRQFVRLCEQANLTKRLSMAVHYLPPSGYEVEVGGRKPQGGVTISLVSLKQCLAQLPPWVDGILFLDPQLPATIDTFLLSTQHRSGKVVTCPLRTVITDPEWLVCTVVQLLDLIRPIQDWTKWLLRFKEKNGSSFCVSYGDIICFTSKGNKCHLFYRSQQTTKRVLIGGEGTSLKRFVKQVQPFGVFYKLNDNCVFNKYFVQGKTKLHGRYYQIDLLPLSDLHIHLETDLLRTKGSKSLNRWLSR